jgi:hypothetical protein
MKLFGYSGFHKRLWIIAGAALIIGIPIALLGFRHSESIDGTAASGYIEDGEHYVLQGDGDVREVPGRVWWTNLLLYAVGFLFAVAGLIVFFVVAYADLVKPIQQRLNPFSKDQGLG